MSTARITLGLIFLSALVLRAQTFNLPTTGVTVLDSQTTGVNGTGVRVAQVEADNNAAGEYEVNPAVPQQPAALFTYYSSSGSASTFPNSAGTESGHADYVAQNFYGLSYGVSTNVAHVDNYEAGAFVSVSESVFLFKTNYTVTLPSQNINDPVINQSFVFESQDTNLQKASDSAYDNYAAADNTLFVSGIGNGGPVAPPSTCYNGLGVGAYGGSSSTGPTLDNGRAQPDLVAPSNETSLSTPQVAGAAACLIQAGRAGVGGADVASATAIATLKALLLNGAIKPPDWTNTSPSPLDPRYGAGVLNIFESYEQLAGGKHAYSVSVPVATGAAHPPTGATATVGVLSGWDFNTNSSSGTTDGVNHYYFNVTNGSAGAHFTATATLVWNRHQNQTAINNLGLFLYNAASGTLVAASTSTVDNVQHVWVPRLAAGRYDLQVWKAGGNGTVSAAEPYAVAFEFFATPLTISRSAGSVTLSWPVYPTGFMLASSTNLLTPVGSWDTNYPSPTITGAEETMTVADPAGVEFFQLTRP